LSTRFKLLTAANWEAAVRARFKKNIQEGVLAAFRKGVAYVAA
jgi:hypothetical protein